MEIKNTQAMGCNRC